MTDPSQGPYPPHQYGDIPPYQSPATSPSALRPRREQTQKTGIVVAVVVAVGAGLGVAFAAGFVVGGATGGWPAITAALQPNHHRAAVASATTTGHELTGTLILNSLDGIEAMGDTCFGNGGYDDIRAGGSVVVTNQSGSVVGTGYLAGGAVTEHTGSRASACTFTFRVSSVPDSSFIGVEVTHRGKIVKSASDLATSNWQVGLTLG